MLHSNCIDEFDLNCGKCDLKSKEIFPKMKIEDTEKYLDPENKQEILDKIKECKTLKEIENLVKETFPDWIIDFLNKYSSDYPHLQVNWETMALKFDIKHAQIMIVDKIASTDKHQLIRVFAEIFTRSGFIVRSIDELFPCKVCGNAIPSEAIYNKMKEKQIEFIPEIWQTTCTSCVGVHPHNPGNSTL